MNKETEIVSGNEKEKKTEIREMNNTEYVRPADIEKRSMEIIASEMRTVPPVDHAPVIRRVIHATADFDYEYSLKFSESAVAAGLKALQGGATLVCDTNMARSGINTAALGRHNCSAVCFMADPGVAEDAKRRGITRAAVSMEKAAQLSGPLLFVIGNAPTALLRLYELILEGSVKPELIIGVPVGFVNVVESKELIKKAGVPYIVADGRKGGSTVAAAISNALLYMLDEQEGLKR